MPKIEFTAAQGSGTESFQVSGNLRFKKVKDGVELAVELEMEYGKPYGCKQGVLYGDPSSEAMPIQMRTGQKVEKLLPDERGHLILFGESKPKVINEPVNIDSTLISYGFSLINFREMMEKADYYERGRRLGWFDYKQRRRY